MTIVEAGARRDLGQARRRAAHAGGLPAQQQEPGVVGRAPALRLRRHPRGGGPAERRPDLVPQDQRHRR
ncbi:hypothetical protein [Nocardioides convexus]|uniref:hypothetical protein n=1 Tax=Nocardioides convexus TaxID=2712224 RepID=UPI0024188BD8|nr:hypothetical protein [Nocardioides convexus]